MTYEIKLEIPLAKSESPYTLELEDDEIHLLVYVIRNFYQEKKLEDSPQVDKMLQVFRKIEKLMLDRSFSDRVAESSEKLNDEIFQRSFIYRS